jgi:hypothetical protein
MWTDPEIIDKIPQQATDALEGLVYAAVFLNVLWGLALCLLGYPLFRVHLVITGLVLGTVAGAAAAMAVVAESAGIDYLIACSAGAILLAMAFWFFYRGLVGVHAALAVFAVTGGLLGWPQAPWQWVLWALPALAAAIAAMIWARPVLVFITAVTGAALVVWSAMMMVAGHEWVEAWEASPFADGKALATLAMAVAAVLLAAGGGWVQWKLMKLLRVSLAPPEKKKQRRGGATQPRFVKP